MNVTYVIVFLLAIIIILLLILIVLILNKKKDFTLDNIKEVHNSTYINIIEQFGNVKDKIIEKINYKFIEIIKENENNNKQITNDISLFFEKTNEKIEKILKSTTITLVDRIKELHKITKDSLDSISDQVNKRLEKGFEKTNETFGNILQRLAKIDEAQKNIDKLSKEVVSLQDVLTDSKTRGMFGEFQLEHILQIVFGEKNEKIFSTQYYFSENNTIVDAVIKTPQGLLCIDAKFPIVHYQKIIDNKRNELLKKEFEKKFINTLKKQIDDISSKYIIEGVTINQAFMFIPAEAIFAEINAYYPNIIEYAYKKRVTIVSPTTLIAMLTIILNILRTVETQKQAKIIQEQLGKLSTEFERFNTRWTNLTKDFEKVHKDIKNIDITSNKIISQFNKIDKLEFKGDLKI